MSVVEVRLKRLAARSLAASEDPDPDRLSLLVSQAVRFYLGDRDGEQAGWHYPSFLGESDGGSDGQRQVSLDEDLWQQLQAEAERQEVSPEDLLQHAAFYYGAARDDGRLTEQIADDLRREEEADRT